MPSAGPTGDPDAARPEDPGPADAPTLLERGRRSYAARAWRAAYEELAAADRASPLGPADLQLLASAAALVGRDAEWATFLERAHHGYVDAGDTRRAVRSAFWIGVRLARAGETGRATGWLARAQRLLEQEGGECVEHGYLLLPAVFRHEAQGELEAAAPIAAEAAEIGQRFGDRELFALATHAQGSLLIRLGRVGEGLALLDEAMVTVTEEELAPFVTGIVYCGTIAACQEVYELERAGEWTAALTRWCEQQPELLAFTGSCLVHRAEIMQLRGEWRDALAEAELAGERLVQAENEPAAGQAHYRRGEVHRLRGDAAAAERAYREAVRCGYEPQPGLALLRLAQGRPEAAAAAIRRVLAERVEPLGRARLLPARVEILLAIGEVNEARAACAELEEIGTRFGSRMLGAMAAHARGAVDVAAGDPATALVALRRAGREWQELGAPYEAACARTLVALACRALGDDDAVSLELGAARETFARLGATRDLAWVDSLGRPAERGAHHGLTRRELEVVRLLAAGRTNREIATELVISEHTVARHVQNIFSKLGVSSRTGAAAFAYEHDLV